jgi:subfamily B ATP-binding cassette protein MsbA
MGIAAVLGIILYGGSLVIRGQGDLSASEFITYIILFSQLLPPAKAMTAAFTNIQRGLAAADRVFDLLDRTDAVQERKNVPVVPIHTLNKSIEWVGVGFRYGDEWVLRNIKLEIKKGQTVALVGHSGSGKSTLADLIPRFMDPQEGKICVDGVDIRDLSLTQWRALLGIVGQDSLLFHDSVLANIAFGDVPPDRARAEEAARVAYAHDFIEALPLGYDTPVGDRGHLLSGGQRQRLCIARAIYRNPPILILDEATSALDTESERWVQAALARIMVDRTSLVIAHRLSTVQHADRIVVLDRGQIVAQGTHDELLAGSARYRRFIDGASEELPDE